MVELGQGTLYLLKEWCGHKVQAALLGNPVPFLSEGFCPACEAQLDPEAPGVREHDGMGGCPCCCVIFWVSSNGTYGAASMSDWKSLGTIITNPTE